MPDPLTMVASDRYAGSYLVSRQVPIEGFQIDFVEQGPRERETTVARNELFTRVTHDVVEMPLSNYILRGTLAYPSPESRLSQASSFPRPGRL